MKEDKQKKPGCGQRFREHIKAFKQKKEESEYLDSAESMRREYMISRVISYVTIAISIAVLIMRARS